MGYNDLILQETTVDTTAPLLALREAVQEATIVERALGVELAALRQRQRETAEALKGARHTWRVTGDLGRAQAARREEKTLVMCLEALQVEVERLLSARAQAAQTLQVTQADYAEHRQAAWRALTRLRAAERQAADEAALAFEQVTALEDAQRALGTLTALVGAEAAVALATGQATL